MADRRGWGCCWLGRCATSVAADAGDVDVTRKADGRQADSHMRLGPRARDEGFGLAFGLGVLAAFDSHWHVRVPAGGGSARAGARGGGPARDGLSKRTSTWVLETRRRWIRRARGTQRRGVTSQQIRRTRDASFSMLRSRATQRVSVTVCRRRGVRKEGARAATVSGVRYLRLLSAAPPSHPGVVWARALSLFVARSPAVAHHMTAQPSC